MRVASQMRRFLQKIALRNLLRSNSNAGSILGLAITTMFLRFGLSISYVMFGAILVAMAVAAIVVVWVTRTTIPQAEHAEQLRGDVEIQPYKKQVTGFDADGKPIFAVVSHQAQGNNATGQNRLGKWLTTLILIAVVGLIGYLTLSNPSSVNTGFSLIYKIGHSAGW